MLTTLGAQAPRELRIHPARISLSDGRDHQRIVVVATYQGGITRDVTAKAKLALDQPVATVEEGFVLRPKADGKGLLTAALAGKSARAVLEVANGAKRPPVSFANEVIPTLTRAGCNAGSCHGAAAGKNGFRLTLFGYDKATDHVSLTRELHGRRVNPAEPGASLMLQKPTTAVAHKGGRRIAGGGPHYARIRQWIAAGAPSDVATAPELVRIEILPDAALLGEPGQRLQLIVRAFYANGTDRDVTDLALLSTMNEGSAKVDGHGRVTGGAPGEAFILARFGNLAVTSQILVVPPDKNFAWPEDAEPRNYIDEAIHAKLRRMRIAPAGIASDEVFLRRAYLDVINVLPTPAETKRFLADARPDKRARLVDDLLQRPEFPNVQAMQWAETLRIESRRLEAKGMHVYTNWLRKAFRDNVPFDEVVRELLTSKGGNFTNPASNFFLTERDPRQIAENVAQAFLGIRIQCAQCHNHPFERWTMDDYYGFAAFFARVATKRGEDPRERIVFARGGGEVRNRRTGRNAVPKFLGGDEPRIAPGQNRRAAVARWLTDKKNPWFAANVANRVWARFFGRGLVDPTDDVRVSNPPSHPGLHRTLGRKLIDYGYDIRRLIRDITSSRTYQLTRHPANPPAAAYASAQIRRLQAEQMLDAISQVCGVPTKYRGLPLGARATEVADGRSGNRFLTLFGRPQRTSTCTCERRNEPTLAQVLHLINGPSLDQKIRDGKGRLHRMLEQGATDEEILAVLWYSAYCRRPSAVEQKQVLAAIAEDHRREAWEDVYWAVLNSKEFLFNH